MNIDAQHKKYFFFEFNNYYVVQSTAVTIFRRFLFFISTAWKATFSPYFLSLILLPIHFSIQNRL